MAALKHTVVLAYRIGSEPDQAKRNAWDSVKRVVGRNDVVLPGRLFGLADLRSENLKVNVIIMVTSANFTPL